MRAAMHPPLGLEKHHLVSITPHQHGFRGRTGRRPGLQHRKHLLLGIGAQHDHAERATATTSVR